MKKIMVFDSTSARRDSHCQTLTDFNYEVFRYKDGAVEAYPSDGGAKAPESYDLILLHENDATAFNLLKRAGNILYYGASASGENTSRVPRSVTGDNPLTKYELKSFCEQILSLHPKTIPDAIAYVWCSLEEIFAFRLLCEAWKCVSAKDERCRSGITIHAPQTLAEWLAPFAMGGECDAKKIEMAASKIGSGEIKNKAKAVLEAVNGNGDPNSAIEEFLQISEAHLSSRGL